MLFSCVVPLAFAQEINLLDLPEQVAEYFGIDEFSAGLLVSSVGLLFGVMLVGFIVRSKGTMYSILIVGISLMSFFVALGWYPVWMLTIVVLLLALLISGKLKGVFG